MFYYVVSETATIVPYTPVLYMQLGWSYAHMLKLKIGRKLGLSFAEYYGVLRK